MDPVAVILTEIRGENRRGGSWEEEREIANAEHKVWGMKAGEFRDQKPRSICPPISVLICKQRLCLRSNSTSWLFRAGNYRIKPGLDGLLLMGGILEPLPERAVRQDCLSFSRLAQSRGTA